MGRRGQHPRRPGDRLRGDQPGVGPGGQQHAPPGAPRGRPDRPAAPGIRDLARPRWRVAPGGPDPSRGRGDHRRAARPTGAGATGRRRGGPARHHDEPHARSARGRRGPGRGPSSPTSPTTSRARSPPSAPSSRWRRAHPGSTDLDLLVTRPARAPRPSMEHLVRDLLFLAVLRRGRCARARHRPRPGRPRPRGGGPGTGRGDGRARHDPGLGRPGPRQPVRAAADRAEPVRQRPGPRPVVRAARRHQRGSDRATWT